MKNVSIAMIFSLMGSTFAFAQTDAISRFFSHYEGREHITDINISGSLFRLMGDANAKAEKDDDFMRMAADIQSIRIIVDAKDKDALGTMREAGKKLSGAYESMMSVRDKETLMEMYVAEKGGIVNEFVMAVGHSENFVVMSVRGKFKLDDIGKLSNTVGQSVSGDMFSATKVGKADFKMWPNPIKAGEKCTLAIPNDMLGAALTVADANGRVVHTENINQIEKPLNLSQLRPGMYVLKMTKGDVEVTKKLVVQ